ncbi:MAG: excisionase family DNA-binding protein [Candidatus Dormibacteria bacterium]
MASKLEELPRLLTVDEAARQLSIGRSHLYEYLLSGSLQSIRMGRSRRIATQDLDAFVQRLRESYGDHVDDDIRAPKSRPKENVPNGSRRR